MHLDPEKTLAIRLWHFYTSVFICYVLAVICTDNDTAVVNCNRLILAILMYHQSLKIIHRMYFDIRKVENPQIPL